MLDAYLKCLQVIRGDSVYREGLFVRPSENQHRTGIHSVTCKRRFWSVQKTIHIIIHRFIFLRKTSIGQGMTILHISPSGHVTDLTVRSKSRYTTEALTISMSYPSCIPLLKKNSAYMTQIIRNQALFDSESPFATLLLLTSGERSGLITHRRHRRHLHPCSE